MTSLADKYNAGTTFAGMLGEAESNVDLYTRIRARSAALPEAVKQIAETGRQWYLLIISEDWCGDAVNIVPVIDALAEETRNLEIRLIERDKNLDLMDKHLTGTSRSIPVAILLDDDFVERGWWGPRPAALQQWFYTEEAQQLSKDDRYRELRTWYARDKGQTIQREIAEMIQKAADNYPANASASSSAGV